MARLIPSFVDDRTPPGERDVFNRLAGGPSDWVILHSLDLAPWNGGRRTEIDFIVVVPDTGIFCIEVKSHQSIYFDGERWDPPEITRSPFKQAADGRFAFLRRIRDILPSFRDVPIVHCCIFPRARFDLAPNLSIAPWELMDARVFRAHGSAEDFCKELKERLRKCIDADPNVTPLRSSLTPRELEGLVNTCAPVHRHRPDAREEVLRREEAAEQILRDQQKPVLSLAERNPRLVVRGGAGTGKTLIAMEVARRAATRGKRVALLCFNKLVGDWMRLKISETGPLPPNLIIGRAVSTMATLTGVAIPEAPTQDFWNNELLQLLEDKLTDPDLEAMCPFDYLVLDEAQDLLARPRLWECLSQFLLGGLEHGGFVLLGDFDNQVLGDRDAMQEALNRLTTTARPAEWKLDENCRNYRIVGDTALLLSGIPKDTYSGYRRTGGGHHNYDVHFYKDSVDQIEKLKQWLRDFKGLGFRNSEISLVSFRNDEESAAAALVRSGYKLRPAWQNGDTIAFSSIHAFKGMENKVVILTDVSLAGHMGQRYLFYTGMTRATECVRVLCDEDSVSIFGKWISGAEQP